MQLKYINLMVEDQETALRFYTTVLGFQKMADIPIGQDRWLTVTSPDGMAGVELLLEPIGFPPARVFQKALYEAGIPATALITRDIAADVQHLKSLDVKFRGEPLSTDKFTSVLFEDTCGNLINLVQPAV